MRRRATPCNRSAHLNNRWAEQDPTVEGGGQPALRPPEGCVPVRGARGSARSAGRSASRIRAGIERGQLTQQELADRAKLDRKTIVRPVSVPVRLGAATSARERIRELGSKRGGEISRTRRSLLPAWPHGSSPTHPTSTSSSRASSRT